MTTYLEIDELLRSLEPLDNPEPLNPQGDRCIRKMQVTPPKLRRVDKEETNHPFYDQCAVCDGYNYNCSGYSTWEEPNEDCE